MVAEARGRWSYTSSGEPNAMGNSVSDLRPKGGKRGINNNANNNNNNKMNSGGIFDKKRIAQCIRLRFGRPTSELKGRRECTISLRLVARGNGPIVGESLQRNPTGNIWYVTTIQVSPQHRHSSQKKKKTFQFRPEVAAAAAATSTTGISSPMLMKMVNRHSFRSFQMRASGYANGIGAISVKQKH